MDVFELPFKLLFAGLWDMVWMWGLGIGLIILCGVGAFFSPLYKKDFIYAGVIIAVALFFMGVGIAQEKSHCKADQVVIVNTVDKVVNGTTTPQSRAEKDKFDAPSN